MKGSEDVSVVMLPLPSQSHLNQMLQLSTLIASHGLSVHFLGSATHNRQAKLRSHGLKPDSLFRIHFHDLPTLPITAFDPDPKSFERLPTHVWPATVAYANLGGPVAELVREVSLKSRRIVIVYDRLVAEAVQEAASVPNTELYSLNCISAFNLFFVLWESLGKPFEVEVELKNLPSVKEFFPDGVFQFLVSKSELLKERSGDIHNTFRIMDGKFIDLLSREEMGGSNKQWAVWPRIAAKSSNTGSGNRHECLNWLDKQAPRSVIYVSFGTTTTFTDEEVREFASGLVQSEQKFIWVLRDADRADIFAVEPRKIELPQGFEEKVQENGMVLRDWAPQLEILAHESVGGFMSHCGWNSCLESMAMGVPVAAWPMHSDQPLNAIFLTEIVKVGLMARKWEERREAVESEKVKKVVQKLMASEEGDEMRRKAEELSAKLNQSTAEGGEEFEDFICHIRRLD